jgi:hypothetical protein
MQDNFLGISFGFNESISQFQGVTLELSENLIIKVIDSLGNVVNGATVTFQIGSDTETAVTDDSGTVGFLVETESNVTVSATFECLFSGEVDILHGGINDFRTITLSLAELPCLEPKPFTRYNFIRWQLSNNLSFPLEQPIRPCTSCNGVDFDNIGLKKPIRKKAEYYPLLVPNEQYSFFTNFQDPFTAAGAANVRLAIIEECESSTPIVTFDINNQVIDGQRYYFGEYTVPSNLQDGYYRIVIYNPSTNQIFFFSNLLKIDSSQELDMTAIIKYRNSDDIDGFKYTELPNFYNKVRVHIYQDDARDFEPDVEDENLITTAEKRYISVAQRLALPVVAHLFDDLASEALESFLAHDEIFVNSKRYNSNLQVDYEQLDPTFPLYYGRFRLYDFDYARKNKYK